MFDRFPDDIDSYSSDEGMNLDVPFVPSEESVVDVILELANIGAKDVLYDLGSGDGRILIAAAKEWGTRGVGIDIDPSRIAEAAAYAKWAQLEDLVEFIEDDIFTADISEATAVTLYLLQSVNERLKSRLLDELRPGTRVVSHTFHMGEWKADEKREIDGTTIYKWIIPAKVAGVWEWERAGKQYRVDLVQAFQEVSGKAWLNQEEVRLKSAELQGRRLRINIEGTNTDYTGSFTLEFLNNSLKSVMSHA